jgi:hypothetical protein
LQLSEVTNRRRFAGARLTEGDAPLPVVTPAVAGRILLKNDSREDHIHAARSGSELDVDTWSGEPIGPEQGVR